MQSQGPGLGIPYIVPLNHLFPQGSFSCSTGDHTSLYVICPRQIFNHSCQPNLMAVRRTDPSGQWIDFITMRVIEGEEKLTIAHDTDILSYPRAIRQANIQARRGIACQCCICRATDPEWALQSDNRRDRIRNAIKGRWRTGNVRTEIQMVSARSLVHTTCGAFG